MISVDNVFIYIYPYPYFRETVVGGGSSFNQKNSNDTNIVESKEANKEQDSSSSCQNELGAFLDQNGDESTTSTNKSGSANDDILADNATPDDVLSLIDY